MKLILVVLHDDSLDGESTVIEFPDRLSCLHAYGILCGLARIKKEAAEESMADMVVDRYINEFEKEGIEGGI